MIELFVADGAGGVPTIVTLGTMVATIVTALGGAQLFVRREAKRQAESNADKTDAERQEIIADAATKTVTLVREQLEALRTENLDARAQAAKALNDLAQAQAEALKLQAKLQELQAEAKEERHQLRNEMALAAIAYEKKVMERDHRIEALEEEVATLHRLIDKLQASARYGRRSSDTSAGPLEP